MTENEDDLIEENINEVVDKMLYLMVEEGNKVLKKYPNMNRMNYGLNCSCLLVKIMIEDSKKHMSPDSYEKLAYYIFCKEFK